VQLGGEYIVFFGALLILLSVLLGMLSSRIGAPLLLVFLGLGMLAGEDGPGGVDFNDFGTAYTLGSIALAMILFDGGLRTPRRTFQIALAPASVLATVGVLLTAGIVGGVAMWLFGFDWVEGLLLGATVASTDAAAVFLLLHQKGTQIRERLNATLEVESGLNDPMAVFLVVACVEALAFTGGRMEPMVALTFVTHMVGGAAFGIAGGFAMVWLINRIEIASGLYPIVAVSGALAIFAGANLTHSSGFLAVYLAGLVMGNRRHRAAQVISRFHDGLAWLCQIGMFLMLGLLVTPHELINDLTPALVVAIVLIFVARPVAVAICLAPFRFSLPEIIFVSWVGLRGAVPIFLASLPVLAGVGGGFTYFTIAFVVVLASLVVQGWTVSPAARLLKLELPPQAEDAERFEIDSNTGFDREIAGYRVAGGSPATLQSFANLHLPKRSRVISVIRDGVVQKREELGRLQANDYVLIVAPPEQLLSLDQLFAPVEDKRKGRAAAEILGEFAIDAALPANTLWDLYGVSVRPDEAEMPLRDLVTLRLKHKPAFGDRVRLGEVDLVVRRIERNRVTVIGIALEPEAEPERLSRIKQRIREGLRLRWLSRNEPKG